MLQSPLVQSLTALLLMVPASLLGGCPVVRRDYLFWGATLAALAGAGSMVWRSLFSVEAWDTSFATTLWVSVAVTVALFAVLSVALRETWRLLPILGPYLLGMGGLATVWEHGSERPLVLAMPSHWLSLHIAVSVATYALLTLAAMAAGAAFVQERALKRKQPTRLSRQLPSVAEAEMLSSRLLLAGEVVLAIGVGSGAALEWVEHDRLLALDHKTLLSLMAFVVIGVVLLAKHVVGFRGRLAARFILLAWLLLTLAYPGVKFVTQVILSASI